MAHRNPDLGCGSNAGYFRHKYAGTKVCKRCQAAHRAYQQARNEAVRRLIDEYRERFDEIWAGLKAEATRRTRSF